jgi:predicted MPP superfamily phosphohydrolase
LVVASGITLGIVLADLVVTPLHAAGHAQEAGRFVIRTFSAVQTPGVVVAYKLGHYDDHHMVAGTRLVMIPANFILYFIGAYGLATLWGRRPKQTTDGGAAPDPSTVPPPPEAPPVPSGITRRTLMRGSIGAAGTCAAAAFGYSDWVAPEGLDVTRRRVGIRGLPPGLEGLRVVQLTDVHHGPWMSVGMIRRVVARINALDPDLIVLTGDFVHRSPAYAAPVAAALGGLRAKIGVVGVLGNHDWWEDGERVRNSLQAHGVRMLDNVRSFIRPDRTMGDDAVTGGLCVAGVGDLWCDRQDFDAALGGIPDAMPRLLLSHNPDTAEERAFLSSGHRVDLMLSGHTHGGQVWVPPFGAPAIPSRYGQKYRSGLVQGPACPVYVSRGIGMAGLPFRFRVPPEVAVIELVATPA